MSSQSRKNLPQNSPTPNYWGQQMTWQIFLLLLPQSARISSPLELPQIPLELWGQQWDLPMDSWALPRSKSRQLIWIVNPLPLISNTVSEIGRQRGKSANFWLIFIAGCQSAVSSRKRFTKMLMASFVFVFVFFSETQRWKHSAMATRWPRW